MSYRDQSTQVDSVDTSPSPAVSITPPRANILVVDNHDSFVHTIIGYLEYLGARVRVMRNDAPRILEAAHHADAVLISPGPGKPRQAGASLDVIAWCHQQSKPMFGVCLGHQALAEHCGATVTFAPKIMHGRTSAISHNETGLFAALPNPLTVTRYHSLVVDEATVPPQLAITARTIPTADDPESVIMALAHRTVPLVSVQFHPEAVLTEQGYPMLENWLRSL